MDMGSGVTARKRGAKFPARRGLMVYREELVCRASHSQHGVGSWKPRVTGHNVVLTELRASRARQYLAETVKRREGTHKASQEGAAEGRGACKEATRGTCGKPGAGEAAPLICSLSVHLSVYLSYLHSWFKI